MGDLLFSEGARELLRAHKIIASDPRKDLIDVFGFTRWVDESLENKGQNFPTREE